MFLELQESPLGNNILICSAAFAGRGRVYRQIVRLTNTPRHTNIGRNSLHLIYFMRRKNKTRLLFYCETVTEDRRMTYDYSLPFSLVYTEGSFSKTRTIKANGLQRLRVSSRLQLDACAACLFIGNFLWAQRPQQSALRFA